MEGRDKAWLRYVAVLTKEYGAQLSYLSVHGYECPQWLIDFGYELREDIGITQEEVDAEIENMKEEMKQREQASREDQDQDEVRGEALRDVPEGSEEEGGGTEEGS